MSFLYVKQSLNKIGTYLSSFHLASITLQRSIKLHLVDTTVLTTQPRFANFESNFYVQESDKQLVRTRLLIKNRLEAS